MSDPNEDDTSSYASRSLCLSTLQLHPRSDLVADLVALHKRCNDSGSNTKIDEVLARVKQEVRSKALDENLSVAVRERWQTWSRQSRSYIRARALSADVDPQLVDNDVSDLENVVSSSDAVSDNDEEQAERPAKRPRKNQVVPIQDACDDWDAVRASREKLLSGIDAQLPSAFRFTERQLSVYAQRLKPRYYSSLEEPFTPAQIRRVLPGNASARAGLAEKYPSTSVPPLVMTISIFASDLGRASQQDVLGEGPSLFGQPRDDHVTRLAGDGASGLQKTQTIELLSSQSLDVLRQSLFCCSDEQPERKDWHLRLQYMAEQLAAIDSGKADSGRQNIDLTRRRFTQDEDGQEPQRALYTGQARKTDILMIIEDKIYSDGYVHGPGDLQQNYVTLLNKIKEQRGAESGLGSFGNGGGLAKRFDEFDDIRVGKTYWMLHQGGCLHAFNVEQIRALRPEEQALRTELGKDEPSFPRLTWLSIPTLLRATSDNMNSMSLGHRMLHTEEPAPIAPLGNVGSDSVHRATANAFTARSKRRDESLLKRNRGRCLACSARKAQIGIHGGHRFVVASSPSNTQAILPGVDDHFTSLCTSCALLLGLPAKTNGSGGAYEIDWDKLNSQISQQAGWTAFPMLQ